MGGWRSARFAARGVLGRPGLWPVALAGFLARGGIVLLVVPTVIPPSLVGLATFIGPASITPTGPTAGLIIRIVIGALIFATLVVAGTIVGAVAEVSLIRAGRQPTESPGPIVLRRIVLIRFVGLVPVALALAAGLERLGEIVYLELTLPTDLVTPFAVRVAARAPDAVGLILVAWLFGETWAGIATRLAVVRGAGVLRSLAGGLRLLVRRVVAIALLLILSLVVAVIVLGAVVALIGWSWDFVRDALLGGSGPAGVLAMVGSTLLFVACWLAGLTATGALAAWRAVAWTLVLGEDHRGSGGVAAERATL